MINKKTTKISIFFLVLIILSLSVFAGSAQFHPAEQVFPGDFPSGNFTFDGNIGIGISDPYQELDINGSLMVGLWTDPSGGMCPSSNSTWFDKDGDSVRDKGECWFHGLYIDSSMGNVGIGVSSLSSLYKLYVKTTSNMTNSRAIHGEATADTGLIYGIYGWTSSSTSNSAGVYGTAPASTGSAVGVMGVSSGSTGKGVVGFANDVDNVSTTIGVYGKVFNALGYPGLFEGGRGIKETCPTGFTSIEGGYPNGGIQIGCMQDDEQGTDTWYNAIDDCFDTYGGRLPTTQEYHIAFANYVLANESDGSNELTGDIADVNGDQVVTYIQADFSDANTGDSRDYRCWLPR